MIFDNLNNYTRYTTLHPGLKTSFEFLINHQLDDLIDVKHTIDGEHIFALGMSTNGKGIENAVFETHRKYIDIQYTVSGSDLIGWDEQPHCTPDPDGYNTEKDVEFYTDRPNSFRVMSRETYLCEGSKEGRGGHLESGDAWRARMNAHPPIRMS